MELRPGMFECIEHFELPISCYPCAKEGSLIGNNASASKLVNASLFAIFELTFVLRFSCKTN